ncbi:MAG: M20 family peptidase, partial [Thermotoga sp.]
MGWKELYEKLVNTDTGRDADKEEKMERTRFIAEILKD